IKTGQAVRWTGNRSSESQPRLSPDGSRIAFIASVNQAGEPYYEPKVFVLGETSPPQRLLGQLPMEALDLAWDASGDGLFLLGNTGLVTNLYHLTLETGALEQLTNGEHTLQDWRYNPDTDTHLARFETAASPGEIFIMSSRADGFRPVTGVYADWPETYQLPRQERFTWRGRRGARIEGLLVYPLNYQPGKAYPLVTITHGGPRNSARFGSWHITRYLPVLAAEGYMVLLPNHRGSSGYGDRFVRDMFGAYFRNAHHDVMDGIDALIERGLVDPDRLVKMGWSAGGHMVNKLITHTDRFAAASSGAGVAEWRSLHGESDLRFSRQYMFGGEPFGRQPPLRQYNRDSPLNRAWKVSTPTLFFVGENDVRVPPTQSILMYRAVEATGTPTVLFQAEDEPHTFRKPGHQLFKINTELSWFARFALREAYTKDLPEEAYLPTDTPELAPVPETNDPVRTTSSP
ncbi:MAG: prolyl oligopeptidase family serine peptidase, partial [Pseudomonadota bacterium]